MTYTIEEQEIIKGFAKELRKKTEALINCLKTDDRISEAKRERKIEESESYLVKVNLIEAKADLVISKNLKA